VITRYLTILLFVPLLFACTTTREPTVQTGEDAEVIMGNLHRVDNSRAGLVYVDPEADLSRYSKILLDPLNLDEVEIIQPSQSLSARRSEWVLTDRDKENLARNYREVFTRELQETGDYEIVTTPSPDALRISAALTGIAPTAAKDDMSSRAIGRTRVYSEGSGTMAIAFGFSDSESGKMIAVVKDVRRGTPTWGINNSVTNMSDVRFIFGNWARMIRARLDIVHGY